MGALGKYPFDPFFIGNVFVDDIPKLTISLETALDLNHFRASIEKTSVFLSTRNKKILCLSVSYGTQQMIALNEKIKKTVTLFKEIRMKEQLIPHITIGRTRQLYGKFDVLPFLEYVYSLLELGVNSLVLYESQLLPKGAVYKAITKFPLN